MALTDIEEVYAEAVDLIGEIELTDTSDHNIKPYSTCARHFPQARDEMVRGYNWNEATEHALCLEDATKPVHTWSVRFPLPDDCLRPLFTTRPTLKWQPFGGYIHTDYKLDADSYTVGKDYYAKQYIQESNITYLINSDFTATNWGVDITYCTTQIGDYGYIELEYVKKLDEPASWSVDLRHAIVLNLASKIVVPITADRKARTELLQELHELVIPHSIAIDAMQGTPKQFFYSEILRSRGEY
jgi:hypothetical protein